MKISEMDVTIKFTEPMLGTVPKDKAVYKTYIASKAPDNENGDVESEADTVKETEDKGWTGFHEDDEGLFIYNYMIKGFIKSACQTCQEAGALKKITAWKHWIDRLIFVEPRRIYFGKTEPDGVLERPIRVMTAQGPRVSLVRSDYIDAGREISFTIKILKNKSRFDPEIIKTCLEYGQFMGLGQWRSGDYGRFVVVDNVKVS